MKCLLTLGLLGMFGAGIVGCEASGSIDDDDDVTRTTRIQRDGDDYERTTTIESDDGRRRVETTVERED